MFVAVPEEFPIFGLCFTTPDVLGTANRMARKPTGVSPAYYHEQIQVPWALISS